LKHHIEDPEVLMLASIASALKSDYVREGVDDPWEGSPFAWIRTRPSRQVGKIGKAASTSFNKSEIRTMNLQSALAFRRSTRIAG